MNVNYTNGIINSISGDSNGITIDWNEDWFKNQDYMKKWFEPLECYCKKEGEDNMYDNEILNLYYCKMKDKTNKEYEEKSLEAYNNLDVVKEYNEIVKEFETTLAELADKYNKEDKKFLIKNVFYENQYSYELNNELTETLAGDFKEENEEDLKKLKEYCDEVSAQLSLSDDLDYQIEILKNYEILDKKTGKLNI